MMTSLRQRNVLLPKFGKIDTFPSSEYQGVANFLSDSRLFYQDLVREFYTHFTILPGCAFSTTARGIEIVISWEDVGACLGVSSEGERISHGFTPDTEGWDNFNNLRFYFSMSRISEQEFYARRACSNSIKLFLSSKNLSFRKSFTPFQEIDFQLPKFIFQFRKSIPPFQEIDFHLP
ncbi:hypothetical protein KIW84_072982 [Lathyrus oleraceus]|uniref:Uncharacterized protein n=1 Tax=Pisum sativum TaxID=3888 RepID=A0A9D4VPM6_PEA|nr:hypothetical protein KIW84_072982 [Pisum sativum]